MYLSTCTCSCVAVCSVHVSTSNIATCILFYLDLLGNNSQLAAFIYNPSKRRQDQHQDAQPPRRPKSRRVTPAPTARQPSPDPVPPPDVRSAHAHAFRGIVCKCSGARLCHTDVVTCFTDHLPKRQHQCHRMPKI